MNDHASKLKGLLWFVATCAVGVVFAFGLSPLAHIIPWSWEQKLGYAVELDIGKQECRSNIRAEALLRQLVNRLYPVRSDDASFSIDVRVVKDPAINAYAALGGKISVNSGLLKQAESAEEVAGVLAHEMEHVHRRHIMQGVITHMFTAEGISMLFGGQTSAAEWANYFVNMDFTREQEAEADEGGLERLQEAHVDNQGFRRFFERMEKSDSVPPFLSDHPSNGARIEMVEKFANRDVKPIMTQDEWKILKNYCSE